MRKDLNLFQAKLSFHLAVVLERLLAQLDTGQAGRGFEPSCRQLRRSLDPTVLKIVSIIIKIALKPNCIKRLKCRKS